MFVRSGGRKIRKSKAVLASEQKVRPETVLASIHLPSRLAKLAKRLERPENFCGMHFFSGTPDAAG